MTRMGWSLFNQSINQSIKTIIYLFIYLFVCLLSMSIKHLKLYGGLNTFLKVYNVFCRWMDGWMDGWMNNKSQYRSTFSGSVIIKLFFWKYWIF
jgi:hypothetical protein